MVTRRRRNWQRDFLVVTVTQHARHHFVCLVGSAFYGAFRQAVISDQAGHCDGEEFRDGREPPDSNGRALAWTVTTLSFPIKVVASMRLANETAAQHGWQWRWMLFADDDCIISPSRGLSRALRGLRARAPWYMGYLDAMWWNPRARGLTLVPAAIGGLGATHDIVQPEDRLQLRLHDSPQAAEGIDVFPACSFPEPVPQHARLAEDCDPQPLADALSGCSWSLVAAACPALWRNGASIGASTAPFGYGMPMTSVYGNGMIISKGMLTSAGDAVWENCEQDTVRAINLTENLLAVGVSRRAARAGDWHMSRCMLSISLHFPTRLPRRFNRTFQHFPDHGRLHAMAMTVLQRQRGATPRVDADGYMR